MTILVRSFCLEPERRFEPKIVTLRAVMCKHLMLILERDRDLAYLVANHRTKRERFTFVSVVADPDTVLLIVGRLLIILPVQTNGHGIEVVGNRKVGVKLMSRAVVGSFVPRVEVVHQLDRYLWTAGWIEVRRGKHRLESPVVAADVGQIISIVGTDRHPRVYRRHDMPVVLEVPTQDKRIDDDVSDTKTVTALPGRMNREIYDWNEYLLRPTSAQDLTISDMDVAKDIGEGVNREVGDAAVAIAIVKTIRIIIVRVVDQIVAGWGKRGDRQRLSAVRIGSASLFAGKCGGGNGDGKHGAGEGQNWLHTFSPWRTAAENVRAVRAARIGIVAGG